MEDPHAMLAALAWQVELGADEALADAPVDRFAAERALKAAQPAATQPAAPQPAHARQAPAATPTAAYPQDAVRAAEEIAAGCPDLASLAAALAAFDGCPLKHGARSCVFADGDPAARVMIVGEAPGRDEDRLGKPFVGKAGQLLDRMLACIGLARDAEALDRAVYITNVLPWWPPGNRTPDEAERRLFAPFLQRHIALAEPDILVPMGNTALSALTGQAGIMRRRGTWTEIAGRPALPMLHPSALLRTPLHKREAWADLRAIRARLDG